MLKPIREVEEEEFKLSPDQEQDIKNYIDNLDVPDYETYKEYYEQLSDLYNKSNDRNEKEKEEYYFKLLNTLEEKYKKYTDRREEDEGKQVKAIAKTEQQMRKQQTKIEDPKQKFDIIEHYTDNLPEYKKALEEAKYIKQKIESEHKGSDEKELRKIPEYVTSINQIIQNEKLIKDAEFLLYDVPKYKNLLQQAQHRKLDIEEKHPTYSQEKLYELKEYDKVMEDIGEYKSILGHHLFEHKKPEIKSSENAFIFNHEDIADDYKYDKKKEILRELVSRASTEEIESFRKVQQNDFEIQKFVNTYNSKGYAKNDISELIKSVEIDLIELKDNAEKYNEIIGEEYFTYEQINKPHAHEILRKLEKQELEKEQKENRNVKIENEKREMQKLTMTQKERKLNEIRMRNEEEIRDYKMEQRFKRFKRE